MTQSNVDVQELQRYLKLFEENPDSRVFAPLADLYRRLGRLDEALDICRAGIRRHPYYAGGRVALAHVLLDRGEFQASFEEADSVVTYYPENLLARKILIRALCGFNELGRAKREYEALIQLSPVLAGDSELERALQGRSQVLSIRPLPVLIKDANSEPRHDFGSVKSKNMNLKDNIGDLAPPAPANSPAIERSRLLAKLLRKKAILETWLKNIEAP